MPRPPQSSHAPHERPVLVRYRPRAPARFVDLRGEIGHWQEPRPLERGEDGAFEATVHLGPGVYAYKLRHDDGSWHLDEGNPRTVARDGARNNVLVVGGTDEPVLHAPGAPWVSLEDDGRVKVRAGLRLAGGSAGGLALRWDEGLGARRTEMRCVAREDEHALFECVVPASARRLRYLFELEGGALVGLAGGGAQAIELERRALAHEVPAWWRDAIVYTIFVDRFRRGGGALAPLSHEEARAGGDLDGVIEGLDWLVELGVTVLHLTPIALAPSTHRYAAIDPRAVDPALGGEAALERLLEATSRRGLRVILDVATTHVHRECALFRDVVERGPASPYWSWFEIDAWPFGRGEGAGYRCYGGKQWDEPLLRFEEPAVVEWLCETFAEWARRGVDGFRVDAAADVPLPALRRIAEAVRTERRGECVLFGEVVPDNGWRHLDAGLHAVTDFPLREALCDLLARRTVDAERYCAAVDRRRFYRAGPGHRGIAFTSTHDQPRLRTLTRDPAAARLGQLLTLLGPEVPAMVWGDEVGLASDAPERGFEGAWPDRMPMAWRAEDHDAETLAMVRSAIALRRSSPALRAGSAETIVLGASSFALRRAHGDEVIDVIAHAAEGEVELALPAGPEHAEVLLCAGDASLGAGTVRLGSHGAIVLARRPRPEITALLDRLADRALEVAEEAYEAGLVEVPASPPRLYVTVTERCNLGCIHCITRAPQLTRDGRARHITPAVIAALEGAFSAARYVGFSHGGESLVTPAFLDVLRAVQRARAGRSGRTDVHLVTNATLLTPRLAAQIVDLGVTSIAVSIDGARRLTNDAIRVGSSLEEIERHVLAAARLRDEQGYDLRIGLSAVLSAPLLRELDELGALAAELGVDWVKVEEMVPVTHPASLLADRLPAGAVVDDAVAALRARCEAAGIVLCDHRETHRGCGCDGDPRVTEFRAHDDFVNRAAFRPCRAAWEQACVDPDGTVRPIDFDQAPLGNVCEQPMIALWNTPELQRARRAALGRRDGAQRARCVLETRRARGASGGARGSP